jgi:hypothetical protein
MIAQISLIDVPDELFKRFAEDFHKKRDSSKVLINIWQTPSRLMQTLPKLDQRLIFFLLYSLSSSLL